MATLSLQAPGRERITWDFGEPKVLVIPPQAHTYAGFLAWVMADDFPEKLRVTFYAGEVSIDMSEEGIDTHGAVKTGVYGTLIPLVTQEDIGEFHTDGVLLCNEGAGVSNNPDAMLVKWESLATKRVRYIERGGRRRAVEGEPDWIMEVLSDSSVHKDLHVLRVAYHRARITEYWLIDARGTDVQLQILVWRKNGYAAVPAHEGWTKSKVFNRQFRLTRSRNRGDGWTYTLASR